MSQHMAPDSVETWIRNLSIDLKVGIFLLTSILRERRILDGKQTNASFVDLLDELERSEANGIQIKIISVQADVRNTHLLALVVSELP